MQAVAPEQVGFSSACLARLGTAMQGYVDRVELSGMLTAIVRRGQLAHLQCFGQMDVEAGKPMRADTIFRIYSMTKPVASVAALMLYERGLYQLDDPASRWIPAFADPLVCAVESEQGLLLTDAEREMTVRDLLTHTSGLLYGKPGGTPLEVKVWQATRGRRYKGRDPNQARDVASKYTLEEFVSWLAEAPLAHQPGSAWRYGFSTDVVGYLVQLISGRSFDVWLQDEVFGPLGMVDTGFYVSPEKLDRLAADTEFWIGAAEDLIAVYLGQCMPSRLYPARQQFKVLAYQALVDQGGLS